VKQAVEEHTHIFEAIKNGDEDQAKQLMRQHIKNDYNRFHKLLNKE